jgi:peptidoglycan-N-acetylglucosamine deacetylase
VKIRKLYPKGKNKAFNITYDDGVLQDKRFIELLDKYNIKGTFNLNSHLMETEFEWQHDNGTIIKRLSKDVATNLYSHHEVASHTLTHPYMYNLSQDQIIKELKTDKENLSLLFNRDICGFALPFDYYNDTIKSSVIECGFEYARITQVSHSYLIPDDFYAWTPSIFHTENNLLDFVNEFLECQDELALCQIAGHSYDLDIEQMWDTINSIIEIISNNKDIISMTHLEIVRYIKSMRMSIITNKYIENKSNDSLWFEINGNNVEILPKQNILL